MLGVVTKGEEGKGVALGRGEARALCSAQTQSLILFSALSYNMWPVLYRYMYRFLEFGMESRNNFLKVRYIVHGLKKCFQAESVL